jgi:hypothetical protein
MFQEWLSQEHHRLHIVEEWPDGPQKEAVLASIRSKLRSLLANCKEESLPACLVCQNRKLSQCVTLDTKRFQVETQRTTEWAA